MRAIQDTRRYSRSSSELRSSSLSFRKKDLREGSHRDRHVQRCKCSEIADDLAILFSPFSESQTWIDDYPILLDARLTRPVYRRFQIGRDRMHHVLQRRKLGPGLRSSRACG